MSESTLALDHQSIDLLLSVMETPNATIAGAVLSDYYEQQAGQLMAANLLETCGHQPVTTSMADHDDAPVSLTWSAEHNGYGYFSPSAGWITVPDERLAVFAIKFPVVLAQMMVRFDIASRGGAVPLLPELLWESGMHGSSGAPSACPFGLPAAFMTSASGGKSKTWPAGGR